MPLLSSIHTVSRKASIGVTVVVAGMLLPRGAAAEDVNPEPIRARISQLEPVSAAFIPRDIDTSQASLSQLLLNDEGETPVLSLDAAAPISSEEKWTPAWIGGIKREGLRSALWLARQGSEVGRPLRNDVRETIALQNAVWSWTNHVNLDSIANSAVRKRSKELAAAAADAPSSFKVGAYAVEIQAYQAKVTPHHVTVVIRLVSSRLLPFEGRQELVLHANGRTHPFKTGRSLAVEGITGDSEVKVSRLGELGDNNTATLRFRRMDETVTLGLEWELNFNPGLLLLPGSPQAPPLVTTRAVPLLFAESLSLDPSTYPGVNETVGRRLTGWLANIEGPLFWFVLLTLLYLMTKATQVVDWVLKRIWLAGADRWRKGSESFGPPTDHDDSGVGTSASRDQHAAESETACSPP